MRFGYVELLSRDPQKTADWWTKALGAFVVSEKSEGIWMALGEVEFLVKEGDPKGASVGIVLYSEDLEGDADHLTKQGCKCIQDEDLENFRVKDPDGRWLTLAGVP